MIKNELIDTFSSIPYEAWNKIVLQEPEILHIGKLKDRLKEGAFSLVILTAGLNAYRLKHNAQKSYFPELYNHLKSKKLEDYKALEKAFLSFYKKELAYNAKLKRIRKLFDSSLARRIYNSSVLDIARDFKNIWEELAFVMDSKPYQKTIVFSMKCLGEALMLHGVYSFEFEDIIPVDSRIKSFCKMINLDNLEDNNIIDFFKDFIKSLRQKLPFINMIYLDSLIWQIAKLDENNMYLYFKDLGLESLGKKLISIIYA